MEEIREFCFKDFAAVCLFWNFLFSGILIILLINAKRDMLIATVPLKVLSGVSSFFCVHFHEKTRNRPSGVCGREYSLVVDGGVNAAQFKQQLVHPALGQLAHDEQTVAGDGCRSAAGFGYAAGSGNGGGAGRGICA